MPSNIKVSPRYMGLRLIEKGKAVTRVVDCSNGFTVVSNFLKTPSATTFNARPSARGTIP